MSMSYLACQCQRTGALFKETSFWPFHLFSGTLSSFLPPTTCSSSPSPSPTSRSCSSLHFLPPPDPPRALLPPLPHLFVLPVLLQTSAYHVGSLLRMQLVQVFVGERPLIPSL